MNTKKNNYWKADKIKIQNETILTLWSQLGALFR